MSIDSQDDFSDLSVTPNGIDSSQQFRVITTDLKKTFQCLFPDCNKTFNFLSEIRRHLIIHYDTRPYKCTFPGCIKTFKRADALTNHAKTHTKTTPFKCPECPSKFTTKSAMKYHVLRHFPDGEFVCPYPDCKKTFSTLSQLKKHQRTFLFHKTSDLNVPEERNDFSSDGQIYYLKEINLNQNHDFIPENAFCSQGISKFSPQNDFPPVNTFDISNQYLKSANEIYHPAKPENNNLLPDPQSPLLTMLGMVMEENRNLKKNLETAFTSLEYYKTKQQDEIDSFFKSGPQINKTYDPQIDQGLNNL